MIATEPVSNFLDGREVQANWVIGKSGAEQYGAGGAEQYRNIVRSQMGLWAEPDTYDWDDDDDEEEGGWQKDRDKQKRGYEPVEGKIIKLKDLIEDITLPVKVGDTILVGRFKNKKMVVKSIGKDKHGMPTINGRKATTFRILKSEE